MPAVCPNGHDSVADDYCDVCGAPIDPGSVVPVAEPQVSPPPEAPAASGGNPCPHCGTDNVAEALFCEACGYDFTTGTMPRSFEQPEATPPAPAPAPATAPDAAGPATASQSFTHVAEVWIDPDWYAAQQSPDPMPSPGLPVVVALRKTSLLIGRPSRSRNIHPDIDCEPDAGASRRQAQLTTDGTRWWVEDLDSANGTFIGSAGGPLPDQPIQVGLKAELQHGNRVFVGAWTKIVIRPATEDEVASLN